MNRTDREPGSREGKKREWGPKGTEPQMGNTKDAWKSEEVSTRQQQIAELASRRLGDGITSLNQHIDLAWMLEAWRQTRQDKAPGVDGQTAEEYEKDLENNLQELINRAKSGRYRAPAVKRVYIPKGKDQVRPIGIPTIEDKVLQRAWVMLLEPVYEEEFLDCSYGFRKGRGPHDAMEALGKVLWSMGGGWVIDAESKSFSIRWIVGSCKSSSGNGFGTGWLDE